MRNLKKRPISFFEHMVFKGTANYPASLLSRQVQALGSYECCTSWILPIFI